MILQFLLVLIISKVVKLARDLRLLSAVLVLIDSRQHARRCSGTALPSPGNTSAIPEEIQSTRLSRLTQHLVERCAAACAIPHGCPESLGQGIIAVTHHSGATRPACSEATKTASTAAGGLPRHRGPLGLDLLKLLLDEDLGLARLGVLE